MAKIKSPEGLGKFRQELVAERDPDIPCISVCSGSSCLALGADEIYAAFEAEVASQGLEAEVTMRSGGCPGLCEKGPIVVIYPQEICYLQVKPEDVAEIITTTIREKKVVERLLYSDPSTGEKAVHEYDIPFYKNQMRLVIGNNIKINSKSIDDYIAVGGYLALEKVMGGMTQDQVIEEIDKSNLRGRSGSGFPVGFKWESCQKSTGGEPKYVICNCHEGDPGAFADRRLLEATPHTVLEGMIIGCYAIGAAVGYIFVGDEFPLTVENARLAIRQAEEYGFLGKNILGSGYDLTIEVYIDGGGYVLGESTALMASMEGKIGEPRTKYDHGTDRGLWAKPTVLNNLQSWANVPYIINHGAEAWKAIGTEESTGTRVFSLKGKVNNTGMIEVPMGMTFRELIYDVGGGIKGDRKFKALEAGGPMGGFIPESLLDTRIDYEEMKKVNLAMGPGLLVIDEDTCIVDMVKFFLTFLANESCGKCTPCREGLKQMLFILNKITDGQGQMDDLELLEAIASLQQDAALCALGQGAAGPLLTTLKHFREEYEAHIVEKRCPAGVCKALSQDKIYTQVR